MKNKSGLKEIVSDHRFVFLIYVLLTTVAAIIKYNLGTINNFSIYRASFFHLLHHQSLYTFYPSEYYDQFLYGPLFSLFIAPFAILPLGIGVVAWCLFNTVSVFFAVSFIKEQKAKKNMMWWLIIIELITSVQNVQVNPFIAALFVFAYLSFEKENYHWAAFFIVLSTFLKVFGILGAALCVFYPGKIKFVFYSIVWTAFLFFIQLIIIPFDELINHYQTWVITLLTDRGTNVEDISVMHFFSHVFHANVDFVKSVIQVLAIILFFPKFLRRKYFKEENYRILSLASVMIWSVIFSHAAESSTYIVAIIGVAIWFVKSDRTGLDYMLLFLVILFSILAPTDIYPRSVRSDYFVPYAIKVVPCLLVWLYIEYTLLFYRRKIS